MSIQNTDIEHNLRIFAGSNVAIRKLSGETEYGKLLWVSFDEQKLEYYALVFFNERVCRIYENEISEIIPIQEDTNDSVINSVRTILSEKYLLWDNGVISGRSKNQPVVNLVNEGVRIRVDYCKDINAEDVEFFEVFEIPSVDMIVYSIERNFEKSAKKVKFWHKRKNN